MVILVISKYFTVSKNWILDMKNTTKQISTIQLNWCITTKLGPVNINNVIPVVKSESNL